MVIKKLIISNFGQFHNKIINLEEGINIIYGENEKGKSTIHKFIEGMFFGFFKPYMSKKMYTPDYKKYLPWEGKEYSGALIYEHNLNEYRIERNFLKGKETVSLYDNNTGRDLTGELDYIKSYKIHEPSRHLGLNSVIYKNTISVNQLGSLTEKNLAKEVKQSLINYGGSKDDKISVVNIQKSLKDKIDKIGTEKTRSKPLGANYFKKSELHNELEKSKDAYNEINKINIEIKELNDRIFVYDRDISKNYEKIEDFDKQELKNKYDQVSSKNEDIKELRSKLDELEKYKNIDKSDDTALSSLDSKLGIYKKQIKYQEIDIEKIQNELRIINQFEQKEIIKKYQTDLEDVLSTYEYYKTMSETINRNNEKIKDLEIKTNVLDNSSTFSNLEDDYYKYLKLDDELSNMKNYNFLIDKVEPLKKEINLLNEKIKKVDSRKKLMIILFFLLIPIFYIFKLSKELKLLKANTNKLNEEIKDLEFKFKEKVEKSEDNLKNILTNYGCIDKIDFQRLYDKQKILIQNTVEYNKDIEVLKEENDRYLSKLTKKKSILIELVSNILKDDKIDSSNIEKLRDLYKKYQENNAKLNNFESNLKKTQFVLSETMASYSEINKKINNILTKNNVKTIEEFQNALQNRNEYDKHLEKLGFLTESIKEILKDTTLEEIVSKIDINKEYCIVNDDISELKDRNKNLIDLKNDLSSNLSRLEERASTLENSNREVALLESLIVDVTYNLQSLENKKKSLELAFKTIEDLSKNIHRDFAPKLNKSVGKMISDITSAKYDEIKISSDLDVKVVDASTSKLVEINSFSTGTIDQLYLATRFGVIDTIKKTEKLPFILDDCFVNYDNSRLENVLNYIVNENKYSNRQILIFSCQTREKEALNAIGNKYNYIEL